MKRFFGTKQKKKAGPPDATLDDVSGNMDKRVDELEKKITRLERQVIELKKKMKKAKGAGKNSYKQKALKLLKQKKQYEKQRDRLMGQQMNVDSAKFAQQSMKDNADTVVAMKGAATMLKQQFKEIDIDEVEDLQDEMMDLMEDANEINDILGEAWGMDDFDEDDLMDELDGLDDELDDLDMDDDEVPSYMVSANAAANKSDLKNDDANVDEYGLPKVPEQIQMN
eukprot:137149_1